MRTKRKCELCSNPATLYCGSDQASLCGQCDSKVHGANFLVAKHSRTLLCHVCQSQTSWSGSGPKLGPAFSVCQTCLSVKSKDGRHRELMMMMNVDHGDYDDNNDDDDDDDDEGGDDGDVSGVSGVDERENSINDDDDDEDCDEDNEDGGDNQVVPWSYSFKSLGN